MIEDRRRKNVKKLILWIAAGLLATPIAAFLGLVILGIIVDIITMRPNWQGNEYNAYNTVIGYYLAQQSFSKNNDGEYPGNTSPDLGPNAYADNFRNLYYGGMPENPWQNKISHIPQVHADAFLMDNALSASPTTGDATKKAENYAGYLFQEDVLYALASEYDKKFAFMGFPVAYETTGRHIIWISEKGVMRGFDPKVATGTSAAELARLYREQKPPFLKKAAEWEEYMPDILKQARAREAERENREKKE